jgi:gluconokinase
MVIILFGVSGSGKTTVGRLLADELGWKFYDADHFHPTANIEKMMRAAPLSDEDRWPWLERLRELIGTCLAQREDAILACSALKEAYRQYLRVDDEIRFIFLRGEFSLIQERLRNRHGHFMNIALLQSQFDTLEEPEEGVIVIDATPSPSIIVQEVRGCLGI